MQLDYQVRDWAEANDLRLQAGGELKTIIEFNCAPVYLLKDGTFIIMALNPFAKCLVTKSESLLDRWIEDELFPTDESVNSFYFRNQDRIIKIPTINEELLKQLSSFVGIDTHTVNSSGQVDEVYRILKTRKALNRYKLNFIILVGNLIIKQHPEKEMYWSVLKSKQFLNPVTEIVLSTDSGGSERYFNIQELIAGKWGYRGMQDIDSAYNRKWFLPNEINTLEKLDFQ